MKELSLLHAKEKGALGESKVVSDLISKGYPCFTEFGDNSKVDIIALVNNQPVKIQVKSHKSTDGKVLIDSRKAGPGYRFRYELGMVDVFALYVYDRDEILYLSCEEILSNSTMTTIRLDPPKNNQRKNVNNADDFRDFERVLRDYEPNTPTHKVAGDDIVQTTTS